MALLPAVKRADVRDEMMVASWVSTSVECSAGQRAGHSAEKLAGNWVESRAAAKADAKADPWICPTVDWTATS
jgi:hypothetical protein